MLTREVEVRVRYGETDAMGVVHHSNYVNYCEVARTEMLRAMGTTYREMEQRGVMMPVVELSMQYFAPGRYDDLLTVRITLDELPVTRMNFRHEIRNQHGESVCRGEVRLAYMNASTRRACRAPEWFLELFRPYF